MTNENGPDQLREHIGALDEDCYIEPIHKGYSADEKYLVTRASGEKVLLRVMAGEQYPRKQTEFRLIQAMYQDNLLVPRPIELGNCEDLDVCYYVLSYIEGSDAEACIREYPSDVQFNIGFRAGRDLRRMHAYQAPVDVAPWHGRVVRKYRAYIEAYKGINVTVKDAAKVIAFIEDHLPLLEHRPKRFQHDDFHVGNIIVSDGNYAGVIDFNRYDWGDPIHDLLKAGYFSRAVSVPFSVGQIQGYFEQGQLGEEFWLLYSTYIAMTIFSSLVWTMRVVPDKIDSMMEIVNRVLEDHKWFELKQPVWYR